MTSKQLLFVSALLLPNLVEAGQSCVVTRQTINPGRSQWSHASYLTETSQGIMAFWFDQGEGKSHSAIWASTLSGSSWGPRRQIVVGQNSAGVRMPVWNPIPLNLDGNETALFFKVGPLPSTWWGALARSSDGGASFQVEGGVYHASHDAEFVGPTRSHPIALSGRRWLAPSSTELNDVWKSHFEILDQNLRSVKRVEIPNPNNYEVIQPTVVRKPNTNCLRAYLRSHSKKIAVTESCDEGESWSPLALSSLPNPSSGINAINLSDGSVLMAYNPTTSGRAKLAVAHSADGVSFGPACMVIGGLPWHEFSYPSLLESKDGKIHLSYTSNRETIEYVQLSRVP